MKYVLSWVRLAAFALVSLSLISCQQSTSRLRNIALPESSAYGVDTTSDYPGVVQVLSPSGALCTGTIVSTRAVLTAAHCTLSSGRYSIRGSVNASTTVKYNYGPGIADDPNDIAILVFPSNTFPAAYVIDIASSVAAGEVARLVGYGCNDLDTRMGAGVKRTGTNVVADVNDYVEFYTPVSSSGVRGILGPQNRAASCYGDSGGPALKE
ncbi:MAG: hypothetical protein EB120_06995, partial [Proteobacteria bacterium]|nr:hypothetical protein [Pseudomonadota bacterium]